MSEFQYVGFRAIDQAVNEKNLEFMEQQSSRAEITAWSFDNEYHYGNFRGNTPEMMRRGYDIHFHYANYGIRNLLILLSQGLPSAAASQYVSEDALEFEKDKDGPGGILCIRPFYESGSLDEVYAVDEILDSLAPLRTEILDGDLRPLYLSHLAVSCDDNHDPEETYEGPVPAGLEKLTEAQIALADLYGLNESLIAAAAKGSPRLPKHGDIQRQQAEWLKKQPASTKDDWLLRLMSNPQLSVGREIKTAFRESQNIPTWPTVDRGRTIAELQAAAKEIQREIDLQTEQKSVREKAKKLAKIAAEPEKILKETEDLVRVHSTENYRKIAKLLSELREALAETHQPDLAEKQAQKLKSLNPTLRTLVSELRREGFLPK